MKKPKLFYGFWIVAVTFICLFIHAGAAYYAFPLFYQPLEAEFGWSRGAISVAFTIYYATQALAAPFIGRLVDQYGAKRFISLGASLSGLGFLWLTFTNNLWSFYGGYVVVGLGMAAMGTIPTTQVVSNWFAKRRGLAIGIMSTGVGVGALVLAPIVGAYLIPDLGWRAAYLSLAIITWVLTIPLTLMVIKEKPSDIGLYPDGEKSPEIATKLNLLSQVSPSWTLSMALKTSILWLIAVGFFAANFSHTGAIVHQVNYFTDIGFPVATASITIGAVGFGSAVGKFFFGWLCDQIPVKYATAISFALQLTSIIILISFKATSPLAMIWLYTILMGVGAGGWLPTMSMITSSNFGLASYGTIFGLVAMTQGLGTALGPLVAGQMFDAMQTYSGVFIMFAVLYMIAIPAMLAVRRPKTALSSS
ncbi:MFS transporter [Chloroflexota bacterium]